MIQVYTLMERMMAYSRMLKTYDVPLIRDKLSQEQMLFRHHVHTLGVDEIKDQLKRLHKLKNNPGLIEDGWGDVIQWSMDMYTHALPKYKKRSIPAALKRKVWYTYIGEAQGNGRCHCCQITMIHQLSFHCGHVVSEKNGGEMTVRNLRPICQNCNSSMGTMNMNEFIHMLK